MGMFERLKSVKKFYLVLALVMVLMVGGAAVKIVHHHFEERSGEDNLLSAYQTYYNLLYLENTNNAQITPEQAKTLLPLTEKLVTVDSSTQMKLIKNIYHQLTPSQYYAVLTNSSYINPKEEYSRWEEFREELTHRRWRRENDQKSIRAETLKEVIVKMLKDKIAK